MAWILFLYSLVVLALVGVAIYEHITAAALSLPISPALTVLAILLPLLSPLTTLTARYLFHPSSSANGQARKRTTTITNTNPNTTTTSYRSRRSSIPPLLPLSLQILQFTLTIILATLFTAPLTNTSPPIRDCLLQTRWRALYSAHDAPAIRAVQDALACCGLRSPRDMAWPFPRGRTPGEGGVPGAATCEVQFGRQGRPCLPPWEAALRGVLGGELGVVLCVGALQVLGVVLARGLARGEVGGLDGEGFDLGWVGRVLRAFGWGGVGEREERDAEGRRPLLAAAPEVGGGRVDEEEVLEGDEADGEEIAAQQTGVDGYGGVGGSGPRVEPAHHDPWAGTQRE